jgi:hypothetical protein
MSKSKILLTIISMVAIHIHSNAQTNTYLKGGDNDGYVMATSPSTTLSKLNNADMVSEMSNEFLYPNIVSQKANLVLVSTRDYEYAEIYDVLGKKIMEINLQNTSNEIELDLNSLVPGAYYLKVIYNGNYSAIKFSKM